jgi:hypothetical protein
MLHQQPTESMRYSYKKVLTAAVCLLQASLLLAQDGYVKGKISNGSDYLPAATLRIGIKQR